MDVHNGIWITEVDTVIHGVLDKCKHFDSRDMASTYQIKW